MDGKSRFNKSGLTLCNLEYVHICEELTIIFKYCRVIVSRRDIQECKLVRENGLQLSVNIRPYPHTFYSRVYH